MRGRPDAVGGCGEAGAAEGVALATVPFDGKGGVPYLASRARSSASIAGGTGAEATGPIPEAPAELASSNANPSAGASFDSGDDPANLLNRLDARGDKRRQRRILGLLVGANSPETGENRRRRCLGLRRRVERAELRRIDRINRSLLERHVWRELVFDVLFDLARMDDVLLMLV